MKWINVKDRLPDESGEYIVYLNGVELSLFIKSENTFKSSDRPIINEIGGRSRLTLSPTHWMPLPKPPKS